MREIGRLKISEGVLKEYSMEFLVNYIKEYDEMLKSIKAHNSNRRRNTEVDKAIYHEGKYILHFKTSGYGIMDTTIRTSKEYLDDELKDYRFEFELEDIDDLIEITERNLENDRGKNYLHKSNLKRLMNLKAKLKLIDEV